MEHADAVAFAEHWAQAWNAHDLEALLAHFTGDVVFTSPVAVKVIPESSGVLRGKDALRAYWARGLELIPDLHFEVLDVYAGLDTVVINYRNHVGGRVCEVLILTADGLVSAGHGTYLTDDAAGGSGVRA